MLLLQCALQGDTGGAGASIAHLLEQPAAQRAFWGIQILDLESGDVVFETNADKLFVPASNTKITATALAFSRLGAEATFSTTIELQGGLPSNGMLQQDLVLVGGGDPNLSSRRLPYNQNWEFGDNRMAPMEELANQVAAAGVRSITASVIGDATRYVKQHHGVGWSINDPTWGYGAPVSALSFNDNTLDIRISPGRVPGQRAAISIFPKVPYFDVKNRLKTLASRTVPTGLKLDRPLGSRSVVIWGDISSRSPGRRLTLAVDDPALFAAMAFRAALENVGIAVEGPAEGLYAHPWEFPDLKGAPPRTKPNRTVVASIESPPLTEIAKIVNKESQNLHAEMLLREVGYSARGVGSFEAGIEELKQFLGEAGLGKTEFEFHDASGLSRKNLITPAAMVKLLRHVWNSPFKDSFLASLPVGGVDGTLDWRFSRTAARGRIFAKTGSLSHVTALSGYARTLDGRYLAFSILVNNFRLPQGYVRRIVDRVCVAMVVETAASPAAGERSEASATP